MDIPTLLQKEEGKTLEFKRDLSSPDKVLQTLIAFANTAGGLLLLGIENRTKKVLGIADPLREEERLANLIADRIEPSFSFRRMPADFRHKNWQPRPASARAQCANVWQSCWTWEW